MPANGEDAPWIVFIREQSYFTSARFLQSALERLANVIPIHIDMQEWFPGGGPRSRLGRFLLTRGNRIALDLRKWVRPRDPEDIDLVLIAEPVRFRFRFPGFEGKKAFIAMDPQNPTYREIHRAIVGSDEFDVVFCTQKDYLDYYRRLGVQDVFWLPHAADGTYLSTTGQTRNFDVAFAGSLYGNRREYLQALKSRLDVRHVSSYLHDLAALYGSSRIVFNKSWGGEVNLRVFESTACGALLLTDRIGNGLSDLFALGQEIVVYDSLHELLELADYYTDNELEREEVSSAGMHRCRSQHSYDSRAASLLKCVGLGHSD